MADPVVERWKQSGQIFFWTYLDNKKNYPGWHLTADRAGVDFFLQLFEKMANAKWSSFKNINISRPAPNILKVPNNMNGRARWRSPKIFKLKHPKGLVPNNYWHLDVKENSVILSVGVDKLNELRNGVENIINNKGDYAIGSDEELCKNDLCVWFWGYGGTLNQ
jgi:hypothetical protein